MVKKYFDINDTRLLFLDSKKELVGIRYEKDKPYTESFDPKFKLIKTRLANITLNIL